MVRFAADFILQVVVSDLLSIQGVDQVMRTGDE
jgi:hypothetical protein